MKKTELPFSFPEDCQAIQERRSVILEKLLAIDDGFRSIPVKSIKGSSLCCMLELYNNLFLNNCLNRMTIAVTLSSRLTSSAGKFLYVRGPFGHIKQAEIRMSSDYLLRLSHGPFELNGLTVSTPQEAFLIVFEHELCHALETLLYKSTGHSPRFMTLANGIFGHTETRHKLPSRRQEAEKLGLRIGSFVSFPYDGHNLTGIVTYIGKTATVMVPSSCGTYRDKHGKRYEKYRVLLKDLSMT